MSAISSQSPAAPHVFKVNIRCHCRRVDLSFDVSSSTPAFSSCICHCCDCRYVTGQMYTAFCEIPGYKKMSDDSLASLIPFNLSSTFRQHFCSTCGATVCSGNPEKDGSIIASTGLLDDVGDRIARWQIFVGATLDGGAALWIPRQMGQHAIRRYVGTSKGAELPDELLSRMKTAISPSAKSDLLPARCQCGAVALIIKRPKENPEAKPLLKPRYKVRVCMCDSCRRCTGCEIPSWASVPPKNIFQADGKPFDISSSNLQTYQSSARTKREFCRTCGAKVFLRRDSKQTWDIAVGLFQDMTARVVGWFDWQDTVDFPEDGKDRAFVASITTGLATQ